MSSTLPPIQPHTQAKHHILRYHIDQWFPILGRTHKTLRYVDGFCGPGKYQGGEPGSPFVALQTIRRHDFFDSFASEARTIEFVFVDKDIDFIRNLRKRLEESQWPDTFDIEVHTRRFSDHMESLIGNIEVAGLGMPPSLIFIDPFGPAGFPMELMARLANFDRVELLINLNHLEFVQWILPDPSKHITADRLYGGPRWNPALTLAGRERSDFLVSEYERALNEVGWRSTSFEMVNAQNQTAYHLVFGTKNSKGLEAMKRAMRDASQTGQFRYTDRIKRSQPVLLGLEATDEYPRQIGEHLVQNYDGQRISYSKLVDDEINWHRWWLESDLRKALIILECGDIPKIVSVRREDGKRRRKGEFTGCQIEFGNPPRQDRLL